MKRYASTTLQTAAAGRVRRPKRRYRAIWISDVHLGTKGCKAATLCDFLGATESTTLYLVGDIIDGWQLRKRWFWTAAQARVVRHILDKARSGTRVIYVPGNHDAHLRGFEGMQLADVVVVDEAVHVTADGRRLLVLHGDEFDAAVKHHAWLAHLGDGAYQLSLRANDALNAIRTRLGFPYWSLSGYLKERVKDAVSYVQDFEEAVAAFARGRGFDGVVCGHIHKAQARELDGVLYLNDGDWVESCTALAEHADGRLEIITWSGHPQVEQERAQRVPQPVVG
jgi:UDP-2,3-diacylglucosamine pyrophosphatase LpxH